MCLPIVFLKFWMFIAGAINIFFGIGIIVGGAKIAQFNTVAIENMPGNPASLKSAVSGSMIGFGVAVILSGIFAIYGGYKRNGLMLFIYTFFAFIFFIVFLALFIVLQIFGGTINSVLSPDQCKQKDFFLSKQNDTFVGAKDYFCGQDYCKCKIDNLNSGVWSSLNPDDRLQLEKYRDKEIGSTNVIGCRDQTLQVYVYNELKNSGLPEAQNFKNPSDVTVDKLNSSDTLRPLFVKQIEFAAEFDDLVQVQPALEWIETTFECTGVCVGYSTYVFSDVNRGVPSNYNNSAITKNNQQPGCIQEVQSSARKAVNLARTLSLVVAIVFFINITLSMCLVCHPKRKDVYKMRSDAEGISESYK